MRISEIVVVSMCAFSAACGPVILPCTDDGDCVSGSACTLGRCIDVGDVRERPPGLGIAHDDREPLPLPALTPPEQGAGGVELPRSCAQVLAANPAAPSGSYQILDRQGRLALVGCDMVSDGGGWTLIADTEKEGCPSGWIEDDRGCDRGASAIFDQVATASFAIPIAAFVEFRGEARAFAAGDNRGFGVLLEDVDLIYVDGLSLTVHDEVSGERAHLWTFAAGVADGFGTCPCLDGPAPPEAVIGEYTCTSPSPGGQLWDGRTDGCGHSEPGFARGAPLAGGDRVDARIMSPILPLFGQSDRVFVTSLVIAVR